MGEADRRTIAAGTPEEVLVRRAGEAVAAQALRMLGGTYGRRVVVVAGKGNNGADGGVAAGRLRARGVGVDEFALADGVAVPALERAIGRADLVIDAMFGTGFRGSLSGDGATVARVVAASAVPVLAVDIPSGVDGTTGEVAGDAITAHETVCFAALKPGLLFEPGRSRAGRVSVADIGIDATGAWAGTATLHVLDELDVWVPRRAAIGHKWSSAALVVGGSPGLAGAPLLAGHVARGAVRAWSCAPCPAPRARAGRAGPSSSPARCRRHPRARSPRMHPTRSSRTSNGSLRLRSGPGSVVTRAHRPPYAGSSRSARFRSSSTPTRCSRSRPIPPRCTLGATKDSRRPCSRRTPRSMRGSHPRPLMRIEWSPPASWRRGSTRSCC
jgi:hydroxyethylthiazole kinase-like uncharacterized protein yjeF